MIVTPDWDDYDDRMSESDNDDYHPPSDAPPPSLQPPPPRKQKKTEPKITLDRSFMKHLRSSTFDHQQFQKGQLQLYTDDEIALFDNNFRKQLHFNFSVTRMSQKQLECSAATRATRFNDIDLDLIPKDMSITTTNRHELSRYILEDLLDCPIGSRFIVCIATDAEDLERGEYFSNKAQTIANEICWAKGDCEYWRMYGRHYFVRQARLVHSSHYSDIKMKAVSQRQFVDAFNNEGGDFALWFDDTSTCLTIPWHDILNASKSVAVWQPILTRPFVCRTVSKMKAQHAHHILRQFASEYYGDSRACLMLFIEYQQAR
jgi:hypothetical protein